MKGWHASAKTRHFVTALRDYYQDKYNTTRQNETASAVPPTPVSAIAKHDEWALDYISITRLHAISEAFDDDASGFITVREVNQFTTSRPLEWR